MFARIVVGYVDGEHGAEALALGQRFSYATGAPLELVTAGDGDGLAALARARTADLIVLGASHRSGLGRTFPGATVERLLGEAPCPVAVAPPGFGRPASGELEWRPLDGRGEDSGMRVIGVGYDDSSGARRGLQVATELALRNGAALRVYAVARGWPGQAPSETPPAAAVPSEAEARRQRLEEVVRELPPEVRAQPVLLRGPEADQLLRAAALGVDLLVLGSRPGGPLRRRLHHSVSSEVLARASCPVLVTPARATRPVAAQA